MVWPYLWEEERTRNLEVSSVVGLINQMGGNKDIKMLEIIWDTQLREVAARVDGMAVFWGGRWFRSHMECMEFATNHIPEGQFQWFIDIVSYLEFVTGDTASKE